MEFKKIRSVIINYIILIITANILIIISRRLSNDNIIFIILGLYIIIVGIWGLKCGMILLLIPYLSKLFKSYKQYVNWFNSFLIVLGLGLLTYGIFLSI
jgi:hypothetical protein